MKTELRRFLDVLINNIPSYVYAVLFVIFCLGTVLIVIYRREAAKRGIAKLLLIEYTALIYCSTVICRHVSIERKFDYTPFWSYDKADLLVENIMNVVVFIPIGLLLSFCIKAQKWWYILLIGGGISLSIEILQLFLRRGYSELDDVMHNTLGCLMGYTLYSIIKTGYEKISRSRAGIL